MFKKCKVVMLPTNKATIILSNEGNKLVFDKSTIEFGGYRKDCIFTPQHLYIISDEEIKEGDWVYNIIDKNVVQVIQDQRVICKADIKIIATTDNLLTIKEYTGVVDKSNGVKEYWDNKLPSPSQSFIDKYISEYNKGNIITEVEVEYESAFNVPTIYDFQQLLISSFNTINIRKER